MVFFDVFYHLRHIGENVSVGSYPSKNLTKLQQHVLNNFHSVTGVAEKIHRYTLDKPQELVRDCALLLAFSEFCGQFSVFHHTHVYSRARDPLAIPQNGKSWCEMGKSRANLPKLSIRLSLIFATSAYIPVCAQVCKIHEIPNHYR